MKVEKLTLSIIVPTYNRSDLITPTLESIVAQDSENYELIVIDDGSTDNTSEVLNELISKHTNTKISYYKIKNGERGAARNFGVSKANGDYVNFFDSDDIAYANHVKIFEKALLNNNQAEVFAVSYDIKNSEGKILKSVILKNFVSSFIAKGNDLSCNGVFIRRDIAVDNPFSENRELSGSEDYELWLRLSAKYDFPCFPEISHAVIQHDARSTMNFNVEPLIKRKLLMLELAMGNKSVMEHYGSAINTLCSSAYSYIALHIAMTGKSKVESIKWFWKSILANSSSIFTRRTLAIIKHLLK